MNLTYGSIISRAVVVGLVAGVLLALYTWIVVEPTIDEAIALEEAVAAAEEAADHGAADHGADGGHSHADEDALFTRSEQVRGGMAATVIYSVAIAAIFGTLVAGVRHRFPHLSDLHRCITLAAIAFGTVALIPGIKYPANPPAVGDPDTVNERTIQYVALIVVAIALAIGLVRLSGWLRYRVDEATRLVAVTAATVVAYGLALIVLPGSPDAIAPVVPAELVWDFRVRSLGGLALTWTVVGLGLGFALDRVSTGRAVPADPVPAST